MDDWAGFTDADLKKIKGVNLKNEGKPSRGSRPSSVGQRRGQQQKRSLVARSVKQPPAAELDENMLLSKAAMQKTSDSLPAENKHIPVANTDTGKCSSQNADTGPHGHSPDDSTEQSHDGSTKKNTIEPGSAEKENAEQEDDMVTDEQEIFKHEQKSMESFQKQHKMIEEMNKMKREKLAQAIKERAKKAKAESVKLTQIQNELSRLDQLLTVDVSIIRDKIEDASREFFEAQKRYDRAEKEFVEAKIDLHKKMEAKESLTEHLYTVIYQNEMRKSKKLAELMTKLEMEIAEEDIADVAMVEMPHPSLLSPVQLPAGRYGQIGAIHIRSPAQLTSEERSTTPSAGDSASQQADTPNMQVDTANQQADTANQQADTANKQVETANQQADTANKQVDTANQHADTANKQKDAVNQQVDPASEQNDKAKEKVKPQNDSKSDQDVLCKPEPKEATPDTKKESSRLSDRTVADVVSHARNDINQNVAVQESKTKT